MRFDAYAGNVYGGTSSGDVAEVVARLAGGRVARGRPRGRYHDVWEVRDAEDSLGWVAHDAQLDAAYFEFKGVRTPDAAGAIRKHWGESHGVSRFDSCEDYTDAGAFDRLVELIDSARDPRVASRAITPRGSDTGRTVYWGSPKSRALVRCYEAGKMPERAHVGRPDWVRAEVQVRPGKAAEKRQAATLSPLDAWGFAAWTRRAAERLGAVEVPRFAPPAEPVQFDRTTVYLARTFRRHFEALLADFGDWECVGREIEAVWRADDETAARLAAANRRRST